MAGPRHRLVVEVPFGQALRVVAIENNVLLPRIMGHTVGISPLVVLVGILVGAALYGLPGAFLAVPVAGGLQVVLAHLVRAEDPEQAAVHRQAAQAADGRARAGGGQ